MNIFLERTLSDENLLSFSCSQVEGSRLNALKWWFKIRSEKYPQLAMLAKGFLSFCASSSMSKRLF